MMNDEQGMMNVEVMRCSTSVPFLVPLHLPTSSLIIPCSIFDILLPAGHRNLKMD